MSLGQLGKNSANEFFETIIYMTAYDAAREKIQDYTSGIENPILREAAESAANVAAFGGIFMIIRYEEAILEKAFAVASGLVAILMGVGKKAVDKLKNATFRGKKLAILSKILGGISDDGVAKAQVVTTQLGNFISSRNNQYQSGNLIDSTLKVRENVVERDRSSLMLGKGMADNYVNSLMFKLLTSSFTDNDKSMIKKILGRDASTELDIEDLNKIGSFMFVQDDTGKITGLTEQFFSLINGLGYLHNK
jgi:hypothetical protein